jgi:tetratricopeptide (TPR) repeat protein
MNSTKTKQSESAKQLFNLCAYFAPEDIPLALFIQGFSELPRPLRETLEDERLHDDLMRELANYSMLSARREASGRCVLSVDKRMQRVIRTSHASDTRWVIGCLNLARSIIKYGYGNMALPDAFERNAPHVLEIAGHAARILADNAEAQKTIAWLYHEAGRGYHCRKEFRQALEVYYKALTIYEKLLGEKHPSAETVKKNMKAAYRAAGFEASLEKWLEETFTKASP